VLQHTAENIQIRQLISGRSLCHHIHTLEISIRSIIIPTERIFMKFDTGEFYDSIIVEALQFTFRSHSFKQLPLFCTFVSIFQILPILAATLQSIVTVVPLENTNSIISQRIFFSFFGLCIHQFSGSQVQAH
jgi:hypothetical protein